MQWIAPVEKDAASTSLERRLYHAATRFRANSGLKAQEYSGPILGLRFLHFVELRFCRPAHQGPRSQNIIERIFQARQAGR